MRPSNDPILTRFRIRYSEIRYRYLRYRYIQEPELIMKSLIPVVMSGILAIYGLVVAVLISGNISPTEEYTLYNGAMHLGCGLCVGFACLSSGYAIGIVGDVGVRKVLRRSRVVRWNGFDSYLF